MAAFSVVVDLIVFICGYFQEAESAATAGVKQQVARLTKRLGAKPVELRRQAPDGTNLSPSEVNAEMVAEKVLKRFGKLEIDPQHIALVPAPAGEVSPEFPLKTVGRFAATYAFTPEATENSPEDAAEPTLVSCRCTHPDVCSTRVQY